MKKMIVALLLTSFSTAVFAGTEHTSTVNSGYVVVRAFTKISSMLVNFKDYAIDPSLKQELCFRVGEGATALETLEIMGADMTEIYKKFQTDSQNLRSKIDKYGAGCVRNSL